MMASQTMARKLWEHPNPEGTMMWEFLQNLNKKHGLKLKVLLPVPVSFGNE